MPSREQAHTGAAPSAFGFGDLPSASSLLSSRWSRDNLVTSHPGRLYDGEVLEVIDADSLEHLIQTLRETRGPFELGAGHMGVHTWDITCFDDRGPFVLQVPRALDEPGRRGRRKCGVPAHNFENARRVIEKGLTRFALEPRELLTLGGNVPAATFTALPEHHVLTFGRGSLEVELIEGERSWMVSLGPARTAELLSEMIAALVYHYEPDQDGGTAIADVCINDGDFVVNRGADGTFALRLTALRHRETGIGPSLLILYLVQMMAYEDWSVGSNLSGLPVLVSNPSLAFEGVVRGLRYRHLDLGLPEAGALERARAWVEDFGRSPEGRSYRPWVLRFLDGKLEPAFGTELRERWWRLVPLESKLGVLELRARRDPTSNAPAEARELRTLLDGLSREIGRAEPEPPEVRLNDIGRAELSRLLAEARVPPELAPQVAADFFARWPYRNLDHLVSRVPSAAGLRKWRARFGFGNVVSEADQGTLRSFSPRGRELSRPLANPELFGAFLCPPERHAELARTFPSFQAYMDAVLHDADFGYYAHRVSIGREGHFETHPESLSPHYGSWIANWAFKAWRELVRCGDLAEADPYPVIEFGAGNGRLARDVLDAIASAGSNPALDGRELFRTFRSRVEYRIYEMSASLREKQRELLGNRAIVAEGDARRPKATLDRDFPNGVRGFVLTNEVPDAFGVHKVVLTSAGQALVALVVPRAEPALLGSVGEALAQQVRAVDASVRSSFDLTANPGDFYLDAATFGDLMRALFARSPEEREALLQRLWFEETYVSAATLPELAAHLATHAEQYATALAAEESGVVCYVNVHAERFIRELGASVSAGFVVTVDYGNTTFNLVRGARRGDFPFRVYGDWQEYVPRPNDPYFMPGTQDLTADVNFTELARAGELTGLQLVHYGPERDVTGDALEAVLGAAEGDRLVAEFLGNSVFKVLVLGTRSSNAFSSPLASPLPLFAREEDVPKARRSALQLIREALASAPIRA